ncbi:superoxide dismutase [Cu-Zn] 5-like isoform X1 [Coccinella septempunctata]|uniref:superoxide dismutase [Cu-Zn] 5-like isoform X1 n=1 Tax=Coccinella septempunctata TaxID=41139 RepID=UPI001D080B6A|nr:superoxide dismutase [Cu-Zn] 5-like isoform X1 [Coccinella septempunctata]XP_044753521.1 superoxide dismutase [Cu-Zn] 5-like isoform X1 [Coccinella septempunctata]XP_044753522.1 superoxide dismutase [Cu-Zn] 5-like isoform X1 [Coccinella septempunctata]XP_044753523.1 superoxide dismutase [Cu-Zn] 5-like isoform X1 [Coccinella septempunctata]
MWRIGFVVLALVYCTSAAHQKAVAVLENKEKAIYGKIVFEETDHGILINGNITGLKEGKHGFHIHEKGDISDPKCLSAGGHFNPFNKTHGDRNDEIRHVGDLGNIETIGTTTQFSFFDTIISLTGENSIIGRAVVIHENSDDLGRDGYADSNTTGHAGARLACAVIKNGSFIYTASRTLLFSMLIFMALQ